MLTPTKHVVRIIVYLTHSIIWKRVTNKSAVSNIALASSTVLASPQSMTLV